MIAWTIKAALGARCFSRTIVSTDSADIGDIARTYGAEVPFMRPAALSADDSSTVDVILHALDTLKTKENFVVDEVCILQPTSPYRTSGDIESAYQLFQERRANAVISVARCAHPPAWMNTLGPDGSMEHFLEKASVNKRSQDLEPYYRLNGAIYWCKSEIAKKYKTVFPKITYAFMMDELRSVDIDTLLDFEFAEFLIQRGHIPML